MDNGQKTINTLFEGRKIFKIPEYQRAYAWQEKQLNDFIDDFKNQSIDKDYFFGTVLFQEAGKRGAYDIIEIVDGQQRITTLIIFMSCLLKLIEINQEVWDVYVETYIRYKSSFKLEVTSDDNEFFTTYILQDEPFLEEVIATPSQKRLYEAKLFFENALKDFSNDELAELLEKVEKTKVLTYSVADKSEATLIFETTNDRGKELTNLEKTKSFLMYKIYVSASEPDVLLSNVQSRFSSMYKAYSEMEGLVEENSILQYNFIAFEKWKSSQDNKEYQRYMDVMKEKINTLFKAGDKEQTLEVIDEYSKCLKETFTIVKNMLLNPCNEFKELKHLGHLATFYPLLIKCYKFDKSKDKGAYRRVCRLCEIYSFRVYTIGEGRANKGQSTMFALARDFNGDFDELYTKLKGNIEYFSNSKVFIENLKYHDFFNYYNKSDMNYFFWKYENYLRTKEQPVAQPIVYETFAIKDNKLKFSIEHILPQTPSEETRKVITDALAHDEITAEFEETYLHSIGNLTIDPLSANSSKGNSDVESKNSKYFKRAPFKTQNELEDFLDEDNKWTHKSIQEREAKLIKFALEQWCDTDNV